LEVHFREGHRAEQRGDAGAAADQVGVGIHAGQQRRAEGQRGDQRLGGGGDQPVRVALAADAQRRLGVAGARVVRPVDEDGQHLAAEFDVAASVGHRGQRRLLWRPGELGLGECRDRVGQLAHRRAVPDDAQLDAVVHRRRARWHGGRVAAGGGHQRAAQRGADGRVVVGACAARGWRAADGVDVDAAEVVALRFVRVVAGVGPGRRGGDVGVDQAAVGRRARRSLGEFGRAHRWLRVLFLAVAGRTRTGELALLAARVDVGTRHRRAGRARLQGG
jgi:hypothetical protein